MNDLDILCARKRFVNGQLKLPWEQHFAAQVLGPSTGKKRSLLDEPSWVGFGDYMQRASSGSQPDYVQQTSVHPGASRRIAVAASLKTDDELLFKSLAMVKFLLLMDLTATSLGDVLAGLVMQLGGEETVTQVLRDTFSKRAPSTVYKRVSAFWRYSKWDQQSGRCNPWYFSEQKIYDYLTYLRSSRAAATSGQCFLSSLLFMHEHVRIKHFDRAFVTPRVKGIEHELLLKKRPLLQARALFLEEVQALEAFVISPSEAHLGIIAGCGAWPPAAGSPTAWVQVALTLMRLCIQQWSLQERTGTKHQCRQHRKLRCFHSWGLEDGSPMSLGRPAGSSLWRRLLGRWKDVDSSCRPFQRRACSGCPAGCHRLRAHCG